MKTTWSFIRCPVWEWIPQLPSTSSHLSGSVTADMDCHTLCENIASRRCHHLENYSSTHTFPGTGATATGLIWMRSVQQHDKTYVVGLCSLHEQSNYSTTQLHFWCEVTYIDVHMRLHRFFSMLCYLTIINWSSCQWKLLEVYDIVYDGKYGQLSGSVSYSSTLTSPGNRSQSCRSVYMYSCISRMCPPV
jgi:hypothetical protein